MECISVVMHYFVEMVTIHFLRGLGGVMVWMELMFDNGIVENYFGIESILNRTTINESNVSTAVIDLIFFERYRYSTKVKLVSFSETRHLLLTRSCYYCTCRHYSSLAWIGLVATILLMSLLVFICAIKCRSQASVNM